MCPFLNSSLVLEGPFEVYTTQFMSRLSLPTHPHLTNYGERMVTNLPAGRQGVCDWLDSSFNACQFQYVIIIHSGLC